MPGPKLKFYKVLHSDENGNLVKVYVEHTGPTPALAYARTLFKKSLRVCSWTPLTSRPPQRVYTPYQFRSKPKKEH